MNHKIGDILQGDKDEFNEAYHPVVYIKGSNEAPIAVVLTHGGQNKYPCNIKLSGVYDTKDLSDQYFVSHFIQKLPDWGKYNKVNKLSQSDLNLILESIQDVSPITWDDYKQYTKNDCPDHKNTI